MKWMPFLATPESLSYPPTYPSHPALRILFPDLLKRITYIYMYVQKCIIPK